SLLFLYRRIFGMREVWFRWVWWTLCLFLIPFFISGVAMVGVMVSRDSLVQMDTLTSVFVIVVNTTCGVINVAVLILPVGMVMGLQLDRWRKLGLIFIFSL